MVAHVISISSEMATSMEEEYHKYHSEMVNILKGSFYGGCADVLSKLWQKCDFKIPSFTHEMLLEHLDKVSREFSQECQNMIGF